MQLDVQWFIYALVSNNVKTIDEAVTQYYDLGDNTDLGTYAQAVLDDMAAGMSEVEANAFLEQIQQVLEYATEQAESGEPPEIFKDGVPIPVGASAPRSDEDFGDISVVDDGPKFGSRRMALECTVELLGEIARELTPEELNSLPDLDNVMALDDREVAKKVIHLLLYLRNIGASDLHISAASPIFMRRMLKIQRLNDRPLSADEAALLTMALLNNAQRERFEKDLDMNLALEIDGSRFRGALMMQRDGMASSFRLVPSKILSLEELGFMDNDCVTIRRLLDYHNGLILVTGAIGTGKTTTLASMVDVINSKRSDHVITVEDPIEIIQASKSCQITQREVGSHTNSYRSALKGALREDPDVIVIGEMHDLETIENAITASETGHLVIGTLHTSDAPNTLNRILDVFPPGQQAQIRTMTAGSLRGVICQKLINDVNGNLTLAYEILVNTTAVGNNISDGKIHQLKASMQIGQKQGMCTMDQCLLEKYNRGIISYEEAFGNMRDASVIAQLQKAYAVNQAKGFAKK